MQSTWKDCILIGCFPSQGPFLHILAQSLGIDHISETLLQSSRAIVAQPWNQDKHSPQNLFTNFKLLSHQCIDYTSHWICCFNLLSVVA